MADPVELSRMTSLLETLIFAKKIRIREVERRLEISNGTLARIFSGKIELKFRHILDLLEILEVQPKTFFKVAYSLPDTETVKEEELLRQVQGIVLPDPAATAVLTRQDVEAMIAEALSKVGGPPRDQAPSPAKRRRKPRPTRPSGD
jgi:transcriptional regulator with XRE-family HTH domain